MPKYASDVIPVCIECDASEISRVHTCKKCNVSYCKHYQSVTDQRFCGNCISDVRLHETILEKTVEHIREDGSVTFSRKYQAKYMKLEGVDWLFASHAIERMNDAEIDATIEYHRANVGIMLQERESRKQERYQKLAGIKLTNTKHETQIEKEKREAKEAAKAGKKRVSSRTKEIGAEALMQMLAQLAKAGMTAEQIIAMTQKGK